MAAITAQLVQIISACQTTIFVVLLLPININVRKRILGLLRSKQATSLLRVLLAVYTMVFILFLDSIYKITYDDIILRYLYESNMYLTGFTLFNALVLYRFVNVFSELLLEAERSQALKKQCMNQKDFVDGILKDLEERDCEIKRLKEEKNKSDVLLRQHKNNESAFFELLDKYNSLKSTLEPKKAR